MYTSVQTKGLVSKLLRDKRRNHQLYSKLQEAKGHSYAKNKDDIVLKTFVGNAQKVIVLRNVYYVSHIRKNLISISQIERKGKKLTIKDGKVRIRNTRKIMCETYRKNDLYIARV